MQIGFDKDWIFDDVWNSFPNSVYFQILYISNRFLHRREVQISKLLPIVLMSLYQLLIVGFFYFAEADVFRVVIYQILERILACNHTNCCLIVEVLLA